MTTNIIQKGNPVLRKKAEEVPIDLIGTPKIKEVLKRMKEALATQNDGVAIAAPQIGESLRIFVVSHKVFQERDEGGEPVGPVLNMDNDRVFINPKITNLSKKRDELEEGCLSVRPWYGKVKRSRQASIEAYDENGKEVKLGASGLLAQIFQHEVDHLEGILFTDKATDLHEMDLKEI